MAPRNPRPTRATTDLQALRHNLAQLRGVLSPGAALALVVKANAYGHGAVEVTRTALDAGVRRFFVAVLSEGIELRQAGVDAEIVVYAPFTEPEIDLLLQHDLQLVVGSLEMARTLSVWATGFGRPARVHVEIDTGMGRSGLPPENAIPSIRDIARMEGIELAGCCTHFPAANLPDDQFTRDQLSLFRTITAGLRAQGVDPGLLHAANSPATINYPEAHLDFVRVGLLAYGLRLPEPFHTDLDLRPVLTWDTEIALLNRQPAGKPLSYNRTYVVPEETLIATLPVGYADGVPWAASNNGIEVLVRNQRVPIVGEVCMDMILADVGDVPDVKVGDRVTLIGRQGRKRVTAEEWARWGKTSVYEIPCRISPRVARDYVR